MVVLQHAADRRAQGVVDELIIKHAPLLNECGDRGVVRAEGKNALDEVAEGRVEGGRGHEADALQRVVVFGAVIGVVGDVGAFDALGMGSDAPRRRARLPMTMYDLNPKRRGVLTQQMVLNNRQTKTATLDAPTKIGSAA